MKKHIQELINNITKKITQTVQDIEDEVIYDHGYPEQRLVPSNHREECFDSTIEMLKTEVSEDIEQFLRDNYQPLDYID